MDQKEMQNVEWKEIWKDEYLRWICGMANAQGGKIYIGVDDNGHVVGLSNAKKLLEDIPNKVRDTLGIVVDVNLLKNDNKDYIEINVHTNSYPVNYKGEYHYRSGSTKQLLQGIALTEFLMKKTGHKWDAVPIENVSVDDLDKESFDIFRKEALRTKRMTKEDLDMSNAELLENLGLIENGKLKRAAILLFHRNPEKWVSGSYIKIGKFGKGSDLQYQDEVKGSLILQADRCIDLIYLKYLKAAISYDKDIRIETYPFPREAVREAVFNAILHKFYPSSIPIQIRIEDHAMYISNDCVFPKDWTKETLMQRHNSRPYNPNLANTFFRAGYVEAWGRGIQKICEACKELGTDLPEYEVMPDYITLCLKAINNSNVTLDDTLNVTLDDTLNVTLDKKILEIILKNPKTTQKEIAEILDISVRSVKRLMKNLSDNGVIERSGGKRFGQWIVKNKVYKD